MLLTPPVNNFFVQYRIDHYKYILLTKTDYEKSLEFKKYLLKQYHANDEVIFKSRFQKDFAAKLSLDVNQILDEIKSYEIKDYYKIQHFYFTLEHPERQAFRDLIIYDNLYEKLISKQLIGISGFLFRKKILEILNQSKILENEGYIYEFSDDTIMMALDNLRKVKEKYMEKNIVPYRQNGDTCAIACMLMILEYFKMIPKANPLLEKKYYKIYKSYYMDGTPFAALAWHFAKNGIETEIVHSESNYFNNAKNLLTPDLFKDAMREYQEFLDRAKTKGAIVKTKVDINSEYLHKLLENDKLIILAGQKNNYLHAILLCGYEDDKFIVCDPLYKQKQKLSISNINEFMDTDIGKWCVIVSQKKKQKEELLANLDSYQKDANAMLTIAPTKRRKK